MASGWRTGSDRTRRWTAALGALAMATVFATPVLAQEWASRGEGRRVEAGSLVDGDLAGVILRCGEASGALEVVLSHNAARFDQSRAFTFVLSVDGTAHVLEADVVSSPRPGDDDLVHRASLRELDALLSALAAGSDLEISGPAGRYRLGLEGSGRAVAAVREGCR